MILSSNSQCFFCITVKAKERQQLVKASATKQETALKDMKIAYPQARTYDIYMGIAPQWAKRMALFSTSE